LYDINIFLDIGANTGDFANQIRNVFGYTKKIISFEPLSSAFRLLKVKTDKDPNWDAFNFALGNTEEKRQINIAGNSYSSSLLDMLPYHQTAAPESKYIGKEIIEVKKLDSISGDLFNTTDRVYMKIDAQGFESNVLKGAENSLLKINTVQLEMALVPLYEGELLFNEMCNFMTNKGYKLVGIDPGFPDKDSGQLLQVEGFFHRF